MPLVLVGICSWGSKAPIQEGAKAGLGGVGVGFGFDVYLLHTYNDADDVHSR